MPTPSRKLAASWRVESPVLDLEIRGRIDMLVFLFTDIEGSTRLWKEHTGAMTGIIARHDEILRQVVTGHGGRITKQTDNGLEKGYHLCWLCGPDLECPHSAVPANPPLTEQFLYTDSIDTHVSLAPKGAPALIPTILPPGPGPGMHGCKQSSVMPAANLTGDVYV